MTGIRRAKADATKARVIASARELFAEKGFFATATSEIVSTAGLPSRGSLYHHFPNKVLLFAAVLEQVEADLGTKVAGAITSPTSFGRLEQALDGFLDASLDQEVRRILLVDGPAVLGWEAWREVEARYGLGALTVMLEDGARDGSITVDDPAAMAHLLLSVVDEAALFIANADDPAAARRAAGASVSALLSGLRSK